MMFLVRLVRSSRLPSFADGANVLKMKKCHQDAVDLQEDLNNLEIRGVQLYIIVRH